MKKLILAAMCAVVFGCTAEDDTRNTLTKAGYSNIEIDGYAFLGCGEDDNFKTKFTATNPNGMRVSGVVCCGVFKGCTIRF